jgi:hypothetical protein
MPKTKRQHRRFVSQLKEVRALPEKTAPVPIAPLAVTAPPKKKTQAPYVNPYEEGPEQNAYVESMRKYGERRNAMKSKKVVEKLPQTLWDEWFQADAPLINATKPIGAWADLNEKTVKAHPAWMNVNKYDPMRRGKVEATVATVTEPVEPTEPPPVPVVHGPVVKKSTKTQLLVGNLPAGIKATQLTAAFEPYGTVTNLNIPIDTGTGYTKGFAFVTFSTADEASAALAGLSAGGLSFPNPLKKGPRELMSTLAYAEGNRKSKGTMRAREGKSHL